MCTYYDKCVFGLRSSKGAGNINSIKSLSLTMVYKLKGKMKNEKEMHSLLKS